MNLGLGLYRHQQNKDHYRFAKQAGCTHVILHWVDYFNQGNNNERHNQPTGGLNGWGYAGDPHKLWEVNEIIRVKNEIEEEGLTVAAIENFDPAHWHDILLDGPLKQKHLDNVCEIIRTVGGAGIPVLGYNFSLAGVAARNKGPFARGGAISVGMSGGVDDPIPLGMVWNMIYDKSAPKGFHPTITHEELWSRLQTFLDVAIPVAESAGVVLAAHPDDPPLSMLRGTPRLVYQPHLYQKLLDMKPSPSNGLEFCIGSLAEMTEGDIYETVEQYSAQNKVAYIHFRNVRGKVPNYTETFIDDGDVDMIRVLQILKKNGFNGTLIPDHSPQMTCEAPWHAGMAHTLGFMKAALSCLQ